MKNFFEAMLFEHEDKLYEGERIDLRQRYSVSEKEAFDGVATVYYDIYLHGRGKIIGSIDLRLTMNACIIMVMLAMESSKNSEVIIMPMMPVNFFLR